MNRCIPPARGSFLVSFALACAPTGPTVDGGDDGGTTTVVGGDGSDSGDGGEDTGGSGSCGDGMVDDGESCDDANEDNRDGCNNECFASGETVWSISVDDLEPGWDWGSDLEVADDGEVVVVGTVAYATPNAEIFLGRFDENGGALWSLHYDQGDQLDDLGTALALGGGDRLYAAGEVFVDGEGQNGWMGGVRGVDGTVDWTDTIDGPVHGVDTTLAVATDASGNAVFGGSMRSAGGFDGWLRATAPDGGPLWEVRVDLADDEGITDIVVGPQGELTVASNFRSDESQTSEMAIVWLTGAGEVIDSRTYPPADELSGFAYGAALDRHPDGDLVLAGVVHTGDWPDIDGEIWLARLDPEGEVIWSRILSGDVGNFDNVADAAFDHQGNLYVAYRLEEEEELLDGYIAKLDDSGNEIWVHELGVESMARALAFDADDNLYYTGQVFNEAEGNWDIVVAKLAP